MFSKDEINQLGELIDKKNKPIKKSLKEILEHVKYHDVTIQETRKRADRIEEVLELPPLS